MDAQLRFLDDPEIFRMGKLPAHSDHAFFPDEEADRENNPLAQSLNGSWAFCYSENPKVRPQDFYKEEFDASGFDTITVPRHIELAGYAQLHYINTMYPWEGHIFRRPAYTLSGKQPFEGMFGDAPDNPVGSYRRYFDLEEGLCGKRVIIRFEGVEQAMYIWLNGSFIGYSEDSFSMAEFDLTPYIREKGNLLAVQVYKRSSAAFLEDQDFFRFFGIFRNVTLLAKPALHLEDMWIKPMLHQDGSGSVSAQLTVSAKDALAGRMEVCLTDGEGRAVLWYEADLQENEDGVLLMPESGHFSVTAWEHENPALYTFLVRLYDEAGMLLERSEQKIGFRRIELKAGVIYLNGKRLRILGVNRHEWSPESGRCIGMEEMRRDMKLFLDNNINAVRTCHYPDQLIWYDMCDENGIYMMAETNLESHGSWQKMGAVEPSYNVPGSLPQWQEAVLDRVRSNFETFKNHASILFWSLGNESYAGKDIEEMNRYLKEKQDGRLIHYEGVFHNRAYEDTISDVESRMYAPPAEVREYLENAPKKPYLLCEYMHDMGNSLGGMASYMKFFDEFEGYHGGFIWDFIDQALWVTDEVTGQRVLRYGGDFDDRPSDYEFSGNGIVFADRTAKPAMQEVRYYYGLYK